MENVILLNGGTYVSYLLLGLKLFSVNFTAIINTVISNDKKTSYTIRQNFLREEEKKCTKINSDNLYCFPRVDVIIKCDSIKTFYSMNEA